jgi:hypothetical protein
MTVQLGGRSWSVAFPSPIVAEYEATEPAARPLYMLACETCGSLCTTNFSCTCCRKYGHAFGGKRVRTLSPHARFPIVVMPWRSSKALRYEYRGVMGLTANQRNVLDAITRFTESHGYVPSIRQLGKEAGLKSSATVHCNLEVLRRKGVVAWDPTMPRTLRLLPVDESVIAIEPAKKPRVKAVSHEPTRITPQREKRPCVYCGHRSYYVEPDGPGKWACGSQAACERRIRKNQGAA